MQKFLHNLKSDESLMLAYQKGDSVAFEVLYMRHKNQVFNFLYNGCQQLQLVEDLAPDASFRTYLYRIARNRMIDHWRKQEREKNVEFVESEHQESRASIPGTEQSFQVKEILDAIMKLPDEQREVFLLREEGFSQQEIAEITDSKPETVKSRARYATRTLRQTLEIVK